jgi:hypothetical protein
MQKINLSKATKNSCNITHKKAKDTMTENGEGQTN